MSTAIPDNNKEQSALAQLHWHGYAGTDCTRTIAPLRPAFQAGHREQQQRKSFLSNPRLQWRGQTQSCMKLLGAARRVEVMMQDSCLFWLVKSSLRCGDVSRRFPIYPDYIQQG